MHETGPPMPSYSDQKALIIEVPWVLLVVGPVAVGCVSAFVRVPVCLWALQ